MGKWKLRIVIILGIAFFLEGLLHNMKRFYVVFFRIEMGKWKLRIHFHTYIAEWCLLAPEKGHWKADDFSKRSGIDQIAGILYLLFYNETKSLKCKLCLGFSGFFGRGTNSSGNFDSNFETLTLETLSSRQFWAWTTTKFKNERKVSWLHPFLLFSSPIAGWCKS